MTSIIYSYSSLRAFSHCPRHFKARYIDKIVKFETSPALEKGRRVHEALESALTNGEPAPVWTPPGLIEKLRRAGAEPEVRLAVDANWQPVDFWDKSAMFRGAIDVDLTTPKVSLMIDWKTGQVRPDEFQADSYAALKRAAVGKNIPVQFHWVFVDQKETRMTAPGEKARDRVQMFIDRAESATDFPPRSHFGCRWCPLLECEYNRNG